jgi:DNA-binding response OmpR family regulator
MAKKISILIIEDEKALADVLEAKLKKEGYNITVANDGQDGYNKIKEFKPDLILLDIVMPKMDGYEVMETMNEEGIAIPVIVISNSGQPVEIEKTQKLGAVDHLIKTEFEPEEVVEKVKKYLEGKNGNTSKAEVKPRAAEGSNQKGVTVLLVEDDSFLRDICAKKLSKEGFSVYEAVDGENALDILNEVSPDIVLLDIILPTIDGFGVLEKIRAHKNDKVKKVPVIMLSNLGQKDDIEKAMAMGANNYLVKAHFTTEEIINKIKKELSME